LKNDHPTLQYIQFISSKFKYKASLF